MSNEDKPKNYDEMTPEELFEESMELCDQFEELLLDENADVPEPEVRDIESIGSGGEYVKKQSSVSSKLEKYFAEPPIVEIGETLQHPKHGAGLVIDAKKLKGENFLTLRFGNKNELEISGTDGELTEFFNLKEAQDTGDVVTSPEKPEEDMTVVEVLPDQKNIKVRTPSGEEKIVDKEFIQKKPVATITKKAQIETLSFDDFWQIGAVPGMKSDVFNDFVRFVKNELPYINLGKCFEMTVQDLQEKGIFGVLMEAFNDWKGFNEEIPTVEPEAPVEPTPPVGEPEVEPEPISQEPEVEPEPAGLIGASKKKTAKTFSVPKEPTSPEEATQLAIEWQRWASEQNMSQGELAEWESYFSNLAQKFNLVDEFVENGIIGRDEEASKVKSDVKKTAQDEPSKTTPQKYAPEPQVAKNPETAPKVKEEPKAEHQDPELVENPQQTQQAPNSQSQGVPEIADQIIESLLMENPQAVIRKIIDLSKSRPDVMAKLDSLIPNPKIVPWHTASWQKKHGKEFARRIISAIKPLRRRSSLKKISADAETISKVLYGLYVYDQMMLGERKALEEQFFKNRFNKTPEQDRGYFEEWVARLNDPYKFLANADSQSTQVLIDLTWGK